jgi:hypothetical protein
MGTPLVRRSLQVLTRDVPGSHFRALMLTLPALVAALVMQLRPPFETMLFDGGPGVLAMNLSQAVLFPYIGLFMLGLGTLFLPRRPAVEQGGLGEVDAIIIRFFAGASLLIALGFGLGLAKLLYAPITITIFCAVLYSYFLRTPSYLGRLFKWLADGSGDGGARDALIQDASIALRIVALAIVIVVLLVSGILVNLYTSDDMQLYFPYLAEVRLQQGIWLDRSHPMYSSFLIGRGNGAHLFFASFTSEFFGQIISVVYLAASALVIRQALVVVIPRASSSAWNLPRNLLPDCLVLVFLASVVVGIDTAKYHTQTNALLLYLAWAALLCLTISAYEARWIFRMLVPTVITIPLMLPQYQALAAPTLVVAGVALYIAGNKGAARSCVWLIAIGLLAMSGSLIFNQLYIGVGELNPAALFLRFANDYTFRQWANPELLQYLKLTQDSQPSVWDFVDKRSVLGRLVCSLALASLLFPLFRTRQVALENACRTIPTAAWLFLAGFFVIHLIDRALFLFTNYPSLQRLLQFQSALIYLFITAGIVVVARLLSREEGPAPDSASVPRIWVPAAASVTLSIVLVEICARVFKVNFGWRSGAVLLMVVAIAYARDWFRSPSVVSLTGFFGKVAAVPIGVFGKVAAVPIEFVGKAASGYRAVWLPVIFTMFGVGMAYHAYRTFRYDYHGALSVTLESSAQTRALRYFLGLEGLIRAVPTRHYNSFNFRRCLEIDNSVPPLAKILALNANYALVPCYNSPLLPRDRVLHHYESVLAPHFSALAFGPAEQAAEIIRGKAVNYFYFQKGDTDFFGAAFGELFSFESLQQRFDVYRETDDFLILTWRGRGLRPVSGLDAYLISATRNDGCEWGGWNLFIDNCAGFIKLRERREKGKNALQIPRVEKSS